MRDLKRALEGASERFDLEPGAIDRFFRRRQRQERRRQIAAVGLVVVVLAGVGISVARAMLGAERGPRIPVSERSGDVSGFPEGSFEHTATVEEAVANGFTGKEAREAFGPDGALPITFVFDAGRWQQIEVDDDGVREVGDNGTYSVEGDTLITVSESVGCKGCRVQYRWTFDGEVLSLVLVSDSAGAEDARVVRLHTEYDFRKLS